jgi:hypothetical protein
MDTLLVNRKLDEAGRPLPKIIRIGSLTSIAKEFGFGENTSKIKKALHQNASLYITASVTYKPADGGEKWLEFGATRYSLVFTGETLPDGRKADAVYLILNDPYREILNSAAIRPLNYDYLGELPPIAQRWYEIIAPQMYAAIKYHLPHIKYRYSDFCLYSAQQRYFDYNHFKKQMYKVHLPHVRSKYLSKPIRYEETTDSKGQMDWFMFYIPGTQAIAEHKTFNSKKLPARALELAPDDTTPVQAPSASTEASFARLGSLVEAKPTQANDKVGESEALKPAPTNELTSQAAELVRHFYRIFQSLEISSFDESDRTLSTALAQARTVIEKHGLDRARYIIHYAHKEAPKTNFDIQVFAGALQYQHKALADYDAKQKERQGREATTACPLCNDSGFRLIKATDSNTGQEYEAAKPCTHNPEIEARHRGVFESMKRPGETTNPS